MSIDALIEEIQIKFITNFKRNSYEFRSNSLYKASIFTLRGAQQGREGGAYKRV